MNSPLLKEGSCSVLIVENATGIIYKKDLTYFRNGENEDEVYQIFGTFQEAKEYAFTLVAVNPKFECSIFDHAGQHLFTYDENGERKYK